MKCAVCGVPGPFLHQVGVGRYLCGQHFMMESNAGGGTGKPYTLEEPLPDAVERQSRTIADEDALTAFREVIRDLAIAHGFIAGDDDAVAQFVADRLVVVTELRATVAQGNALVDELRAELVIERDTVTGLRTHAQILQTTLEQVTGERDAARAEVRRLALQNPSAAD